MSHFAVAVITDGTSSIDDLLAPYQENCCSEPPKEYMEFYETEPDDRHEYHTGSVEFVLTDGELLKTYNERFRVDGSKGSYGTNTHKVPDNLKRVSIPYTLLFSSFDEYMTSWRGEHRDADTGRYGYWQNPNAKWDWFMVGGRFRGSVRAIDGGRVEPPEFDSWIRPRPYKYKDDEYDQAKLGDLVFDVDAELYKRAVDEWRVFVDGESVEGVERPFFKREYYIDRFVTCENYARLRSTQWYRAVVTPDGKWHEVGEMLWWGITSEKGNSIVEWADKFKERFIDPYPSDYLLTVVDCHI